MEWPDVQRRIAGGEDARTEFKTFGLVLTERQIIPSATIDDIDFGAVRTFMRAQGLDPDEAPQPAREDDLRNGSIVDELDGVLRPTLYGLMVFGRDPQAYAHTLSLFVQCTAYGGTDQAAEVLSAGEGRGRLQDQVQRAMGWFRSLGRRETYEGIRRIDVPPAPEAALREALVNAVIHRDYAITGSQVLLEVFDDRIVVTSPGALPNHMTVDQARKGGAPRSRNEMMANAMVVGGLMERRGRGWLTMRRFNGTEPELVSDERNRFVRVTFARGTRGHGGGAPPQGPARRGRPPACAEWSARAAGSRGRDGTATEGMRRDGNRARRRGIRDDT